MVRAGQLDDRLSETLDELQSQKKGVEDAEDTEDESQARAAALARVVSKPVVAPTKPKRLQPGLKLLMDDPTNPSILNTDSIKVSVTPSLFLPILFTQCLIQKISCSYSFNHVKAFVDTFLTRLEYLNLIM